MENIYELIMSFISDISGLGIFLNCLLIIVESIIPPLPLGLFITILFVNYGTFIGFIISWISTIIGCVVSFYLFQTIFKEIVDKYIRKNKLANKFVTLIDNIKFNNLVLIIAIPFTPAYLVNIAAGVSKISIKKYFKALLIGKISLVLFWGLIGTNIIDSFKNPISILKVLMLILITYLVSKIINKKFNIN